MKKSPVSSADVNRSLKRARFFLHPDKLPPNFTSGQRGVCKAVWDILNEAAELHAKGDDLDWIG